MDKIEKILIYIIISFLIITVIQFKMIKNRNYDISVLEHNLRVMRDTTRELVLRNGEIYKSNTMYISKNKELEKVIDIDQKTIKDLENRLGSSIAMISKLRGEIAIDTIRITDTVYKKEDSLEFRFNYNNDYINLSGWSFIKNNISYTTISNISLPVNLTLGISDNYALFVNSDNPYIMINSITGAVIEDSKTYKKKRRWWRGVQVGVGIQYSLIDRGWGIGPYIGYGIGYIF